MVIAVAVFGSTSEPVAASDKIEYRLTWLVQEVELATEERLFDKRDEIAETKLLPIALHANVDPIVSPRGRLLAPANTQFFAMRAAVPMVCSIHRGSSRAASSRKHLCLTDADQDGAYDGYFTRNRDGRFWFTLDGEISPAKIKPIAPMTLSELSKEEMRESISMAITFSRFLDAGNAFQGMLEGRTRTETAISFGFRVGTESKKQSVYQICGSDAPPPTCFPVSFPAEIEVLGLRMTVNRREGEEAAISVVGGFKSHEVYMETGQQGYAAWAAMFTYGNQVP